eukprot:g17625.t1
MQRSEVVPTSSNYRKRSFSSPGRSFLCEPEKRFCRTTSAQRTFIDHVDLPRDDSADSMFNADCVSGFLVSETHHGIIHFDISPETVDSISGILFVLLGVVAAVYGTVRYYAIRSGLAHQNNNRVRRMGYRRIGIRWFVSGLGLCAALAMSLVFLRRFCGDPD